MAPRFSWRAFDYTSGLHTGMDMKEHSPTPRCLISGLLSSPNNLVKSGVADDEAADEVVVVLAVVEV
jgi:hypothetical protein